MEAAPPSVDHAEVPDLLDEINWFMTSGHERRGPVRRDPYPFYERLRAHQPVHRSPKGPWLLTSYDACNSMLRDERFRKARILTDVGDLSDPTRRDAPGALAERILLGSLVFQNPPVHTRLRRIVSPLFTAGAIIRRRERTRSIARELLGALHERDTFDFRLDFSSELPIQLICELIGIPDERREDFLGWASTVRELQEHGERTTEHLLAADQKARDCLAFFAELAEQRRDRPGEDIVSMLVAAAAADEEPLSVEEFAAMLVILHVGGHSTTTDVIATGMYNLLRHPGELDLLRQDTSLIPGAVDEMLRYDPPVTVATPRMAAEDIVVGDTVIPAGESVYAVLAAANRDPAHFTSAAVFDVRRPGNRHISFAVGPHFCLGAHLGRQEAEEAFAVLLTDFPALELDAEPGTLEWQDSFPHRGLELLPVAWSR
jgi:cytochrome P450